MLEGFRCCLLECSFAVLVFIVLLLFASFLCCSSAWRPEIVACMESSIVVLLAVISAVAAVEGVATLACDNICLGDAKDDDDNAVLETTLWGGRLGGIMLDS